MNWIILFLIIFLVISPMVLDIHNERVVLAEDIKNGKLSLTPESQKLIDRGDLFLKHSGCFKTECSNRGWVNSREYPLVDADDLYRAFIAKVFFERARLEMELRGLTQ